MKIDHPSQAQLPALLQLWKQVFGEHDGFWELFLATGFSRERCLCVWEGDALAASLCWLDCRCGDERQAYLYAVMTHPDFRGRRLCAALMAHTHAHLARAGYAAALLVPENPGLRRMYAGFGYRDATSVSEFTCKAGKNAIPLRALGPEEYGVLRRELLPAGGVLQEGENLAFLAAQTQLLAGPGVLLAAWLEQDHLHVTELLGDTTQAPAILAALGCETGTFRCPGQGEPFAMFRPLKESARQPVYFGLAFD